MKNIYNAAIAQLMVRATKCLKFSKSNVMDDYGWTDARSHSYWMIEHYSALNKIEKIKQRIK